MSESDVISLGRWNKPQGLIVRQLVFVHVQCFLLSSARQGDFIRDRPLCNVPVGEPRRHQIGEFVWSAGKDGTVHRCDCGGVRTIKFSVPIVRERQQNDHAQAALLQSSTRDRIDSAFPQYLVKAPNTPRFRRLVRVKRRDRLM